MSEAPKIALIELFLSHDECLLTQMIALKKRGCEILLVCPEEMLNRNPHFSKWIDGHLTVNLSCSKAQKHREIGRIWYWLKKENIQKVVLNTAQGALIKALCWRALFSKIEFIGILHTTRKLEGSFTQKFINWKIRKYLFLSQYLFSKVKAPKGISLDFFYPIDFPIQHKPQTHDGVRVAIIGGVERRRKDLEGFCNMMNSIDSNVHITFLGYSNSEHDDVRWLEEELARIGKKDQVTMFKQFVDHETFAQVLSESDWILPLIHPDTPSADQYFRNQISGAMTVSFSFRIPMLIHEGFAHIEEMNPVSTYYSLDNFMNQIKSSSSLGLSAKMKNLPICDSEEQQNRFANFVLKN